MSLKSKAKAARKRDQAKRAATQEQEALARRAEKLKTATAGFARTTRTKAIENHYEQQKLPSYVRTKPVNHVGDEADRFTGKTAKDKPMLSPEMQQREDAARQRTKDIQKRVDIGYNKGGLMLLSESEFLAMQRGELKRRS